MLLIAILFLFYLIGFIITFLFILILKLNLSDKLNLYNNYHKIKFISSFKFPIFWYNFIKKGKVNKFGLKEISTFEISELPFGSIVKIIWIIPEYYYKNDDEHTAILFEKTFMYLNGKSMDITFLIDCLDKNYCKVYLIN